MSVFLNKRSPLRAVFRCDASVTIGGGHVMRCLSVAERLWAAGWWCGFASDARSAQVVPRLLRETSAVLSLAAAGDLDPEEEALVIGEWVCGHADLLLVDHYQRDVRFEHHCRAWAERIAVIDDLADRAHDADILIDPSCGHTAADYGHLVPTACRVLAGSRHALIRPAFPALRECALSRRSQADGVQRILIGFGATDPDNATALALRAIAVSGLAVTIDVVLGAGCRHADAVRTLASSLPQPTKVHIGAAPDEIARLMSAADLAIGAGGGMAWERCCVGLPSVVLEIAENQRLIVAALARAGAALNLGCADSVSAFDLASAIRTLARDNHQRQSMAAAAAQMCDGRGLERLTDLLGAGIGQAA